MPKKTETLKCHKHDCVLFIDGNICICCRDGKGDKIMVRKKEN